MEKIFDKEVENYLKESGVADEEINRIKYKKYKQGMLDIVSDVKIAIEKEDIGYIRNNISFSPAGDDMGEDNTFIDFGSITGESYIDINDAFSYLKSFKI